MWRVSAATRRRTSAGGRAAAERRVGRLVRVASRGVALSEHRRRGGTLPRAGRAA
jgi:hypothetical protein